SRTRLHDRPTRRDLTGRSPGDGAGRPRLVVIAQWPAVAEARHLQRKVGTAHAPSLNRADAGPAGTFLDGAVVHAVQFGLIPPRLALGEHVMSAAARQRSERAQRTGA